MKEHRFIQSCVLWRVYRLKLFVRYLQKDTRGCLLSVRCEFDGKRVNLLSRSFISRSKHGARADNTRRRAYKDSLFLLWIRVRVLS